MVTPVSNVIQTQAPVQQSMSTENSPSISLSHCEKAACCIGSTFFLGGIGMCIATCSPAVVSGTALAEGLIFGGCGAGFLGFGIASNPVVKLISGNDPPEEHRSSYDTSA